MHPALRLLTAAAMVYVGLAAVVFFRQRQLIYVPTRVATGDLAAAARDRGYRPWADSAGNRIGWWKSAPGPAGGTVLVTHGNASIALERGYVVDPIQEARPLDVFVLEYPGFADRPGQPSQVTLLAAAADGLHMLTNRPGPLYLVGESLGTGVAAYLAGQFPDQVAGVCLLAPYTDLGDVAADHFPWLPARWLLRDRFPAAAWLRRFNGPVAVFVGESDHTVPPEFGRRLHEGYAGPKRLWSCPDQEHWEVIKQPATAWEEAFTFLETSRPGSPGSGVP